MARVAFYDPFLDVLGGGEKVLLTVLEDVAVSERNEVAVLSPTRPDPRCWSRLGVDVAGRPLRWRCAGQLSATPLSAGADLFVTLTNHFPPLSLARRSATIIQFPFARIRGDRSPLEALRGLERGARMRSYDDVICYSRYAAAEIRERLGIAHPLVVAPPVDLPASTPPIARERKVIAVGRFFPAADANNKKHDVLIDAWRALAGHPEARGWELHLVGGLHSDPASKAHLDALRRRASGLPVHFHPNAEAGELQDLYRRSSLFWHATGHGEVAPERFEHFGITTVEAMAHGCVPIVVALGGQLEIVDDGVNGRLWSTLEQLVAITLELIADPPRAATLRHQALQSASTYGKQRFLALIRAEILDPAGVPHG
jgi:glycosyltransferase involved in cell wall biosynthesis